MPRDPKTDRPKIKLPKAKAKVAADVPVAETSDRPRGTIRLRTGFTLPKGWS
ncbi:hypothetical protein ACFXGD_21500 [Streptomyces albidoflavus]